ncbi:MAG: YdiY family protein [Thiohalophilus sp.]
MAIARQCSLGGFLVVLATTPLMAAEEADEPSASQWAGAAELGFIMNRGNTDSDSLNTQLRVENSRHKWRHRGEAKALRISEEDTTTAESYEVSGRSDYLLDENDYLFGSLRYESDEFAGYDRRTTEVLGYGHQFLKREDMHLKGEFGVGGRQTKFVDDSDDDESIVRVGLDYKWQISKTSSFSEVVYVEHGSNNTYTESVTALTAKLNNSLAMKVSYTIKDNSDPQPGFDNTDTRTAITLVYDF